MALFVMAQTAAWFQTNGLLINKWLAEHVVLTSVILGPLVGIMFAYGTKAIYAETEALWVARFLGFASGYLIFIPLTWYFFGETPFTVKNMISLALCVILICVQVLVK
jgi:hypothetical protein